MYDSIMWDYMKEEKTVLSAQLRTKQFADLVQVLQPYQAVYITAHGSSYNAAFSTAALLARIARIRVYVYNPSDFIYNCTSIEQEDRNQTLVMGISQTGTSNGVIKAMQKAKDLGFSVLAVTAVIGSLVDRLADHTYILSCGPEDSNAKTKGYSCTLLFLMQLAYEWGIFKHTIVQEDYERFLEEVGNEINNLPAIQFEVKTWCEQNDFGKGMHTLFVMGNGAQFGSAQEGMLKLMETQCIPTMFTNSMEFSHGMHRCAKAGDHAILIISEEDAEDVRKTAQYLKEKGICTLVLDLQGPKEGENAIVLPYYETSRSLLSVVAAVQVISCFVPENNGYDPNRDANDDYTGYMKTRG